MNGCLGCLEMADIMISETMVASYEGSELVIYQQVTGRNEEWEIEVIRLKCDYCIHCGRVLDDEGQETD